MVIPSSSNSSRSAAAAAGENPILAGSRTPPEIHPHLPGQNHPAKRCPPDTINAIAPG